MVEKMSPNRGATSKPAVIKVAFAAASINGQWDWGNVKQYMEGEFQVRPRHHDQSADRYSERNSRQYAGPRRLPVGKTSIANTFERLSGSETKRACGKIGKKNE